MTANMIDLLQMFLQVAAALLSQTATTVIRPQISHRVVAWKTWARSTFEPTQQNNKSPPVTVQLAGDDDVPVHIWEKNCCSKFITCQPVRMSKRGKELKSTKTTW